MRRKLTEVSWELWLVGADCLGIKTIEERPRTFAYNHGRNLCEHLVRIHNEKLPEESW